MSQNNTVSPSAKSWSQDQCSQLTSALVKSGLDWSKLASAVPGKSPAQIQAFCEDFNIGLVETTGRRQQLQQESQKRKKQPLRGLDPSTAGLKSHDDVGTPAINLVNPNIGNSSAQSWMMPNWKKRKTAFRLETVSPAKPISNSTNRQLDSNHGVSFIEVVSARSTDGQVNYDAVMHFMTSLFVAKPGTSIEAYKALSVADRAFVANQILSMIDKLTELGTRNELLQLLSRWNPQD